MIRRLPGVVTVAVLAVVIGLMPMPCGYYMLLRLFLCDGCIYYLFSIPGVRDGELAGLPVLQSPFVPAEMGSEPLRVSS